MMYHPHNVNTKRINQPYGQHTRMNYEMLSKIGDYFVLPLESAPNVRVHIYYLNKRLGYKAFSTHFVYPMGTRIPSGIRVERVALS